MLFQQRNPFKNCQVLAIDLSLSSLAYAKRKTDELGIKNNEYMQVDILQTKKLKRNFDIIEASGVLHHMKDPIYGWNVLLSSLKSGGLMKVGLYRKLARRHIIKTRSEIDPHELKSNCSDKMGSFRKKLIKSGKPHHKAL